MKILIVDDEEHIRRLLAEELESEGLEVLTAMGSNTALNIFNDSRPDLVTLDIRMQTEKEGIELLRAMKAINPHVRIIMLSAFDYTDDLQVWAADKYITKSSDLSELKNSIRELLGIANSRE